MPARRPPQCPSRKKQSLGKLRRAHPASGATWNIQVVRGKMTSKCLWHACRALALGLVLMFLGAGMATLGYYADHLSTRQELRGNQTVQVKNESRGFYLNNLSYVGPIVMGFGGFIVVAACVMTFEARDSAAKVVPARYKMTWKEKGNTRSNMSSISTTEHGSMDSIEKHQRDLNPNIDQSISREKLCESAFLIKSKKDIRKPTVSLEELERSYSSGIFENDKLTTTNIC